LGPNGEVTLRLPVRRNVFSAIPPRGNGLVATVVAYDASGQEVWRSG
jgi:hypothetical protein